MGDFNLTAQSVLELSHCEIGHDNNNDNTDDDDNDTHPGWIMVCNEKYSATDKKNPHMFVILYHHNKLS